MNFMCSNRLRGDKISFSAEFAAAVVTSLFNSLQQFGQVELGREFHERIVLHCCISAVIQCPPLSDVHRFLVKHLLHHADARIGCHLDQP